MAWVGAERDRDRTAPRSARFKGFFVDERQPGAGLADRPPRPSPLTLRPSRRPARRLRRRPLRRLGRAGGREAGQRPGRRPDPAAAARARAGDLLPLGIGPAVGPPPRSRRAPRAPSPPARPAARPVRPVFTSPPYLGPGPNGERDGVVEEFGGLGRGGDGGERRGLLGGCGSSSGADTSATQSSTRPARSSSKVGGQGRRDEGRRRRDQGLNGAMKHGYAMKDPTAR